MGKRTTRFPCQASGVSRLLCNAGWLDLDLEHDGSRVGAVGLGRLGTGPSRRAPAPIESQGAVVLHNATLPYALEERQNYLTPD
jgi:hypothetical protein